MSTAPIVVGVDLSRGACEAVWWALVEARRRAAPVVLLHAPDGADAELAATGSAGPTAADAAQAVLDAHLAHAATLAPELAVTTRLESGGAVDVLVEASRSAGLLVLGSRGRAGLQVSALGSVSQRVAVHAHCPVVIVPEGALRLINRRVLAGVAATRSGELAVADAAEQAHRWDGELVLFRARGAGAEEEALANDEIRQALKQVQAEYPDLPVEVSMPAGDPGAAIVEESRRCDLVVLGCHHSDDLFNCRLGAVPSGVLGQADCPVMLVGQQG